MSVTSLAVVLYYVDLQQMVDALRLADYRLVIAGFLLSFIWLLARAGFWRTLLQEKASFSQVFHTVTEGYLLNNILPFRLGELARIFLIGRKANLAFWEVFPSIMIERALDMAIAAGLLLSTLPFVFGATWARQAALLVGGLVAIALLTLYLLARNPARVMRFIAKLGERWSIFQKISGKRLEAFFEGLSVLTRGNYFFLALVWVTLNWGVALLQYYILLKAFFPEVRLLWASFSLGVGALGIAAPSSPGAVGVLEASLVGALALFGLNASTALAFAITAHFFSFLVNGVLGAYALARDGETLSGLYTQVRQMR